MASYFCWETFPKGRKNETRKWKWRGETKALQMKNRLASPSSHLVNARPRWKVEEGPWSIQVVVDMCLRPRNHLGYCRTLLRDGHRLQMGNRSDDQFYLNQRASRRQCVADV